MTKPHAIEPGKPPQRADAREPSRRLGLFLCGLVAAYFLISPIYALLKFEDFASATPQLVRYVIIPSAIALLLLAIGLFARPAWSAIVGVCTICVLITIFMFEGFLTLRQLPVHFANLGQTSGPEGRNDNIVRSFTIRQLNKLAGAESLPEMVLSGFPQSDVLLCAPEGQAITYRADRYGFNNPDSVYGKPIDVALLGDSFVEGFCLPPGDDLASQLRQHGVNVASLGIRGNGPLLELAALGRFGPELKPKHVVMAFFEGNDWENLRSELKFPSLQAALSPGADFGTPATATATETAARSENR